MDGTQIIGFRSDYPGTMFPGFYFEKIWDIFPVKKGKFGTICLPLWVIIGICLNNLDQASRELKTTLPGVYHQLQTKRLI